MFKKILIALFGTEVSPRFDLATEVLIASVGASGKIEDEKTLVLPHASAEKLCHMIVTEDIQVVICGGIEDEYYQYLTWKRVRVIDSVIGDGEKALERFCGDNLHAGDILIEPKRRGKADQFHKSRV